MRFRKELFAQFQFLPEQALLPELGFFHSPPHAGSTIENVHAQNYPTRYRSHAGNAGDAFLCRKIEILKLANPVPSGTAWAPGAWNSRVTG
jgi:hypothetical protein